MDFSVFNFILLIFIAVAISYLFIQHLKGKKLSLNLLFNTEGQQVVYSQVKLTAAEEAIVMLIATDLNGNVVMWNKMATKTLLYTEMEMLGKPMDIIIPERYKDRHMEGMRRYKETGESRLIGDPTGVELYARRRDGTELPIRLTLTSIKVHKHINLLASMVDITIEKDILRKSELLERGESIAKMGTWHWDILTDEAECSQNFLNIFELRKGDVLNFATLFNHVYYQDVFMVHESILKSFKTKTACTIRYRTIKRNGAMIWIKCSTIILQENNSVTTIDGVVIEDGLI